MVRQGEGSQNPVRSFGFASRVGTVEIFRRDPESRL